MVDVKQSPIKTDAQREDVELADVVRRFVAQPSQHVGLGPAKARLDLCPGGRSEGHFPQRVRHPRKTGIHLAVEAPGQRPHRLQADCPDLQLGEILETLLRHVGHDDDRLQFQQYRTGQFGLQFGAG